MVQDVPHEDLHGVARHPDLVRDVVERPEEAPRPPPGMAEEAVGSLHDEAEELEDLLVDMLVVQFEAAAPKLLDDAAVQHYRGAPVGVVDRRVPPRRRGATGAPVSSGCQRASARLVAAPGPIPRRS